MKVINRNLKTWHKYWKGSRDFWRVSKQVYSGSVFLSLSLYFPNPVYRPVKVINHTVLPKRLHKILKIRSRSKYLDSFKTHIVINQLLHISEVPVSIFYASLFTILFTILWKFITDAPNVQITRCKKDVLTSLVRNQTFQS